MCGGYFGKVAKFRVFKNRVWIEHPLEWQRAPSLYLEQTERGRKRRTYKTQSVQTNGELQQRVLDPRKVKWKLSQNIRSRVADARFRVR